MSEWKTRVTKVHVTRPAPTNRDACVVLIYPQGAEMGRRFPLDKDEFVLGRGSDCDIQVDRDSVSRRHAKIVRAEDGWAVEDLNSTNGSYVNDVQIMPRSPLRDGDLVKIGAAIFKFLSGENVEVAYHEEIYKMTIVDGLTGVHNKRYFQEFLDREIARCLRHGRPLALVMLDIDHFKKINDTHGHLTGDHVLRELAKRLNGRMRREELLARYGGEEFAIVLPETGKTGALEFGEQLRGLVARDAFEFEGDKLEVTISVGVAVLDGEQVDIDTFIKRADDNLYAAKRGGRNMVIG